MKSFLHRSQKWIQENFRYLGGIVYEWCVMFAKANHGTKHETE